MAQETVLGGIIDFFVELGVYDVVLPFLLVFTILYAILDKTKVFGHDTVEGTKYPKKNINAMVAFVMAFFVVASTKLVAAINTALADVVLLILLVVFFLVLVGIFFKEGSEEFLDDNWKKYLTTLLFAGIVLIFLNALDWLSPFWDFIVDNWESRWVGSLILIILIVLFMSYITNASGPVPAKKKEE